MMYDCAITKNYLVLPLTPLEVNHDMLKSGGNHSARDPEEDQWNGIVSHWNRKPGDIVWLRAENTMRRL
ncbi:hypothetical protein BDU57DRAFT_184225 [Ampelomyces quisqualis]|uniref:Uncharacterized protein n=1 Tax=Ampelomyces quisqualis TaxID=50730 RepID=A0A6A5QRJ1_AMPQU|nr:hypothetical protein BDU57DRAFT_184225 [Ampelomyces quisqualis]